MIALCQLGISSTPGLKPIAPIATYLASERRARLAKMVQPVTNSMLSNSGKNLLVIKGGRSVQDRHWNSAANDGLLPGATAGAHISRPGRRHRRGHGARSAAHPVEAAGARCQPLGQIPGLAAADAEPVTR